MWVNRLTVRPSQRPSHAPDVYLHLYFAFPCISMYLYLLLKLAFADTSMYLYLCNCMIVFVQQRDLQVQMCSSHPPTPCHHHLLQHCHSHHHHHHRRRHHQRCHHHRCHHHYHHHRNERIMQRWLAITPILMLAAVYANGTIPPFTQS